MSQHEDVQKRTKHIDMKYHVVKNLQKDGVIKMIYCPSTEMLADVMTKPLPKPRFEELLSKMNFVTWAKTHREGVLETACFKAM